MLKCSTATRTIAFYIPLTPKKRQQTRQTPTGRKKRKAGGKPISYLIVSFKRICLFQQFTKSSNPSKVEIYLDSSQKRGLGIRKIYPETHRKLPKKHIWLKINTRLPTFLQFACFAAPTTSGRNSNKKCCSLWFSCILDGFWQNRYSTSFVGGISRRMWGRIIFFFLWRKWFLFWHVGKHILCLNL